MIDDLLRGVILPDLLPIRDSERAGDNLCYRGLQHHCAALRGPFIPHFALNASIDRLPADTQIEDAMQRAGRIQCICHLLQKLRPRRQSWRGEGRGLCLRLRWATTPGQQQCQSQDKYYDRDLPPTIEGHELLLHLSENKNMHIDSIYYTQNWPMRSIANSK